MRTMIFPSESIQALLCGQKSTVRVPISASFRAGEDLYVRETWTAAPSEEHGDGAAAADGAGRRYLYKADEGAEEEAKQLGLRWYSPATMPNEAARIFLHIRSIHPERIQDVTDDACIEEGAWKVEQWPDEGLYTIGRYIPGRVWHTPRECYRWAVWYKRKNGRATWNANSLVWVIRFDISSPSFRTDNSRNPHVASSGASQTKTPEERLLRDRKDKRC